MASGFAAKVARQKYESAKVALDNALEILEHEVKRTRRQLAEGTPVNSTMIQNAIPIVEMTTAYNLLWDLVVYIEHDDQKASDGASNNPAPKPTPHDGNATGEAPGVKGGASGRNISGGGSSRTR